MKKKGIYGVLIGALAMGLLTGCGDGSEENGTTVPSKIEEITAEPLISDTERELMNYEQKYSTGEFTMEDYQALANLYGEAGFVRKQRDMLEQSYRLYQDTQAFEMLQTIAVNLAEEDTAISGEAQLMLQNMELPEYFQEAIHMIDSENWTDTMMPKLYEGKRNYFLVKDGRTALSIQAGYDENGGAFSYVWYYDAEGQVTFLGKSGSAVQVMTSSLAEGAYDGAFELWTLEGATGSIYHEQGTFAKGVLTGDYTMSAHVGTEAGNAFDLWNNREGMSYDTYTGSFDGEGRSTAEQPSEQKLEGLLEDTGSKTGIVYAYGENARDCLFLTVPEGTDTAAYSFGAAEMGLEPYPDFPVYEVKEDTAESENTGTGDTAESSNDGENTVAGTASEIKVRIFDGEVQFFDGEKWVNAGSVSSLSQYDPFQTYAQGKEAYLAEKRQNSQAENASGGGRFQTGTIEEDKPQTPAANKPANNKPTQPAAPETPTTQPVTPPAQQPSDNGGGNNDSGGSSGGGDTGSSGGGSTGGGDTGSSGGGDTGGSDSGSSGNETDIEWSPDIM